MSKNSLSKYYQENRDYKKKAHKSSNIVVNKGLFSVEKNMK